jgi:hypothetical protein
MNPLFYCSPLVPFNYVPMYLPNIIHALEPCYHSVVVHPSTTKGNYVPMYLPNIIHALEHVMTQLWFNHPQPSQLCAYVLTQYHPCIGTMLSLSCGSSIHNQRQLCTYVLTQYHPCIGTCYDSILVHPSTTKSIMCLCTYPISSMHWNHVITQLWFIHPQPSHQGSILVTYTRNSPTSLSQHLGN